MSGQPKSFEEFRRQRELERLRRKARGEETGEHAPVSPTPAGGTPERRRRTPSGRHRSRSSLGW